MTEAAEILPVTSILLIFYLLMLFFWSRVKRPAFYFMGAVALLLIFIGPFFVVGPPKRADSGLYTVQRVFDAIGALLAFVFAFLACYGAALPGVGRSLYQQAPPAGRGLTPTEPEQR